VRLSQKRYLPIGSAGKAGQTWGTPVCLRYPNADGPQRECFLLESVSAEFPLTKTDSCPAYLYPNANAQGYYIATYSSDLLPKVIGHAESLNNAEKVSLLHDLAAGANAGHMKLSAGLTSAQTFAASPERKIVGQVQAVASSPYGVVPLDLMPNYQRYIQAPPPVPKRWDGRPSRAIATTPGCCACLWCPSSRAAAPTSLSRPKPAAS